MLGEALKLARRFHNLTPTQLSDKLGISRSYLSEIENEKKKPTLDLLKRYSEVLSVPVSQILLFSEAIESNDKGMNLQYYISGKALSMIRWLDQIAGAPADRDENG